MRKCCTFRFAAAILIIAALVMVPLGSAVFAQEQTFQYIGTEGRTGEKMLADLLLVRPVGIVASAVGICAFVISLPFTLLGNNTEEAGQRLVADPIHYTFTRPLGEL
jgi:hypothetical protein